MFDDETIISGFESQSVVDSGPIDFSRAKKLGRGGSTCDVYVTRYYRRRVFIKRLKETFRNDTVYRTAFDKEFELGASLSHKSLPAYREFHDDYIVMDYIDGVTLAEILRGDSEDTLRWLKHPENVERMIGELIEVVGYLHRHNVVHCDIKPDNILISDETRNLMLIDFDKAYTPWRDDTRGSASLYGVDIKHGRKTEIDFHGIGMVIDRLKEAGLSTKKLNRLRSRCFEKEVSADELSTILEGGNKRPYIFYSGLFILSVVLIVCLWLFRRNGKEEAAVNDPVEVKATVTEEATMDEKDSMETLLAPVETSKAETTKDSGKNYEPDFEAIVGDEINPLYGELEKLRKVVTDADMKGEEIMDALMNYVRLEEEAINQACRNVNSSWAFETKMKGNERTMMTGAYSRFRHYSDSIQREVSDLWRKKSEVIQ